MTEELTKEILDERFIFNLETGVVTNRIMNHPSAPACVEAGYLNHDGYRIIQINGRDYKTARIIWFYAHGSWPTCVDHVNHRRDDNRLVNLRDVTQAENHRNKSKRSNNKSGVAGVSWDKAVSKWRARIQVNGEQIHLGLFTHMADAITARAAAKVKYGYHPNHA